MVQISNLLKQSSDSNLIQGFVTSPVRCILTFSQIRHFKRIDLKLLFNSYAFHEYYCWAFENLINTLGGPMTDYLSVLVQNINNNEFVIRLLWFALQSNSPCAVVRLQCAVVWFLIVFCTMESKLHHFGWQITAQRCCLGTL